MRLLLAMSDCRPSPTKPQLPATASRDALTDLRRLTGLPTGAAAGLTTTVPPGAAPLPDSPAGRVAAATVASRCCTFTSATPFASFSTDRYQLCARRFA